MPPKKAKSSPKQPAVYRQKRQNRQDTAFVIIDGQRIHLGIFGTPEAETEYRRLVAEWNANIVAPKQINSADCTVAELVLRFLKERKEKASPIQWDKEQRICAFSFRFMATPPPRRSTSTASGRCGTNSSKSGMSAGMTIFVQSKNEYASIAESAPVGNIIFSAVY